MEEQRIYDLREDADLYQKDIAKILGVTQQTYSLWELGKEIISLKHLNTLCNYYNVSMDYTLKLSNNKNSHIIKRHNVLNKKEIGKRLRIIRQENKLSFRVLAKKLNTTPSTIHAYETGKTLILTVFAYQICKEYNISFDWLCGRSNEKSLQKEKELMKV